MSVKQIWLIPQLFINTYKKTSKDIIWKVFLKFMLGEKGTDLL